MDHAVNLRPFSCPLIGVVVALLSGVLVRPVAAGPGEAPALSGFQVHAPFRQVSPGHAVTIALDATHAAGVRELYLRCAGSHYEHMHGELVEGRIVLHPTGAGDRFEGSLVMPAVDADTGDPLPAGRYRISLTSFLDGSGTNVWHPYVLLGHINVDPAPHASAGVALEMPAGDGTDGRGSVAVENPTDGPRTIELELSVLDHFQRPVLTGRRALTAAVGTERWPFTFPAVDAKRFRADLRFRVGDGPWQTRVCYADAERVASGPRRLLRLESGPWQRLVPADAPQSAPTHPPAGAWEDTTFPLRPAWSATSHWTWFRQTVEPEAWLEAERVALRLGQADYQCHVYVNGVHAGVNVGASTPFTLDVSAAWRRGAANVLALAVGDITTVFADPTRDEMVNCLTPAVSSRQNQLGIWEHVSLAGHAATFIEDVFVMPAVEPRVLRVRTTLHNSADGAVEARLGHVVEDRGRAVLTCADEAVTLGPGETRTLEARRPWPDARLWWPHDPCLYRLRTRLRDEAERPLDERSTRFGFRELTLDGPDVRLNGRVFRPLSKSMTGVPATHVPDRGSLAYWLGRAGPDPGLAVLLRTHQSPHPRWQIEIADEIGACIELESQFNSVVVNATHEPRFWSNAAHHLRACVRRDRNSPSVVLWSIANEVLHASGATRVSTRDELAARMKALAAEVKRLDPTRPVVEEGGADFDGTGEMLDLHYPRMWYNHVDFPNAAFWLKPGARTANEGGQAPIVTWHGDKPLSIGESGDYFQTRPPHDMATYAGDRVYGEPGGYGASQTCGAIDAALNAGYIEGYRTNGAWRIACDLGGSGGAGIAAALRRIRLFVWPKDDHFFAGDRIERRLRVFHDVLSPSGLKLTWRAVALVADREHNLIDEREAAAGEVALVLAPGARAEEAIAFTAPSLERPAKLQLQLALEGADDGAAVFRDTVAGWVHPRVALRAPAGGRVAMYDPSGRTAAALAGLGITLLDELGAAALEPYAGLVIGEDVGVAAPQHGPMLERFVAEGGTVVMLRQRGRDGIDRLPPDSATRDVGIVHTHAFVRAPGHPAVAGLDDGQLRLWSVDHVVAIDTWRKRAGANFVALIDAGAPRGGGLAHAPLAEMRRGRGRYLLCQMALVANHRRHPGAARLLQNLLDVAAGGPLEPLGPAATFLGTGEGAPSARRRLLDALGVTVREREPGGVSVAIVDAEGLGDDAARLRRFAEAGATVLVKGLSPDNVERFAPLLGVTPTLVPDARTRRPVQSRRDPLLWGISDEALYWERRKGRFAWKAEEQVGIAVYAALLEPGPGVVDLYRTEPRDHEGKAVDSRGAGLAVLAAGRGRVVVDQVRWAAACEEQPGGWGGRVSFAEGLRRYVSCLLTNLGVEQGAAE